jgi:hypothetical protein
MAECEVRDSKPMSDALMLSSLSDSLLHAATGFDDDTCMLKSRFHYFVLRPLPLDLLGAVEVIFDVCISSPMYLRNIVSESNDNSS